MAPRNAISWTGSEWACPVRETRRLRADSLRRRYPLRASRPARYRTLPLPAGHKLWACALSPHAKDSFPSTAWLLSAYCTSRSIDACTARCACKFRRAPRSVGVGLRDVKPVSRLTLDEFASTETVVEMAGAVAAAACSLVQARSGEFSHVSVATALRKLLWARQERHTSGCWGLCFNPRCAHWRRLKTLDHEKRLHRPSNHDFLAQLDARVEAGGERKQL